MEKKLKLKSKLSSNLEIKKGLNSNQLKIIAMLCMVIDHIGYFFSNELGDSLYILFRTIGRIAMPIFVFSLVEGFFYTKNFKKYVLRIFLCAVITQAIIYLFELFDGYFGYNKINKIEELNILFSFTLILLFLRIINKKILKNNILDIFVKCVSIIVIVGIYMYVKLDYGIYLLLIALTFFVIKKYFKSLNIFLKTIIEMAAVALFSLLAIKNIIGVFAMYSIFFIMVYNEKKGKGRKKISKGFYVFYPLQFLLIYIVRILI